MTSLSKENEMNEVTQLNWHKCPECGATNDLTLLSKNEYRCCQCNLEMAHIDFAANGAVRGIFGWLRQVGDTIDNRFQIKSILGKGGFGVTYLVEDLRLSGKRRAIKEVPELLYDEYETTLLSRLTHPAIPDIIDRGIVDGMVYLVLEFGGNRNLGGERKLHQGRIPLALLLPWIRQLCEVLIYLHSQDPPIIHRDLKPDNILLDENGRIMLIDFGIAKESKPSTMTRTIGRAVSHGFSPPEQAMGTGTDERSDIYALAATFYALLTGTTPPAAHERLAGKELIPPSQIITELPAQLDTIILRALSFNINQRQQTMLEFSQALDGIDSESRPSTRRNDTERTVLLDKAQFTEALKTNLTSIKLPDGSRTQANSVLLPTESEAKPKPVWLFVSIAVGVVLIGGVAYYFYSTHTNETKSTTTPPVAIIPSTTPPITATIPALTTAPSTIAVPSAVAPPSTIAVPTAVAPPSTIPVTHPPVTPPPTTSGSAMDRLLKGQPTTTPDKVVTADAISVKPSNKPRPQKTTRQPSSSPVRSAPPVQRTAPKPDNNDWLNDLKPHQVK